MYVYQEDVIHAIEEGGFRAFIGTAPNYRLCYASSHVRPTRISIGNQIYEVRSFGEGGTPGPDGRTVVTVVFTEQFNIPVPEGAIWKLIDDGGEGCEDL